MEPIKDKAAQSLDGGAALNEIPDVLGLGKQLNHSKKSKHLQRYRICLKARATGNPQLRG
jgi:hypothetical protein